MDEAQATSPATGEQLPAGEQPSVDTPGFGARGRMRRRARFLRKARELAYRDLGGLVYSLHRFGKRNDSLVLAKLDTIARIDNELRALETALAELQPVTVLREAGVAACPRCAAIHGSDDRFCPNCGLAMDLRAERPYAAAPPSPAPAPSPAPGPSAAPAPSAAAAPAPAPTPVAPVSAAAATASIAAAPAASAPATSAPAGATTGAAPATAAPGMVKPAEPARAAGAPRAPSPPVRANAESGGDPQPDESPADSSPAMSAPAQPGSSAEEPTEIIRPPVQSS